MAKIETTAEFLARGGKIQHIPSGVNGVTGQELGLFMRGEKNKARESISRRREQQSRENERIAKLF